MQRTFDDENVGNLDDADALNSNKLKLVIDFNNSNHNEYFGGGGTNIVTSSSEILYPSNRTVDSIQPYSDSTNENWPISSSNINRPTHSYLEENSADYMPNFQNNNNSNRLAKIFDEIQPKIDAVSDS